MGCHFFRLSDIFTSILVLLSNRPHLLIAFERVKQTKQKNSSLSSTVNSDDLRGALYCFLYRMLGVHTDGAKSLRCA